jgi:hypothetical protein
MLNCKSDGTGGSFLIANPQMQCWTDTHTGYVVIAGISLGVYLVLLPAYFCYVLFYKIPATGLDNTDNIKTYGFLYERFLPKLWYWEIIETSRKFIFVLVAKLGERLNTLEATIIALASVGFVLLAEVNGHPFKSPAYDALEQITTLTEVILLVLGVLVLQRDSTTDAELDWIESVAWVFIGISFAMIAFATIIDLKKLAKYNWMSSMKTKLGVKVSAKAFDLQCCNHLIPTFLAQATPEQLTTFKEVEAMVKTNAERKKFAGKTWTGNSRASGSRTSLSGVTYEHAPKLSSPANLLGVELDALDKSARGGVSAPTPAIVVPATFLFNGNQLEPLLSFLKDDATDEQRAIFVTFFDAVQDFEIMHRGESAGFCTTLMVKLDDAGLRKNVLAKNNLLNSLIISSYMVNGRTSDESTTKPLPAREAFTTSATDESFM